MSKFFIKDGQYFEALADVSDMSDGRIAVPQRPAPHWDWDNEASQWVEGALVVEKRVLPRWAFMQVLDEAGLTAGIASIIAALPAGPQKSRAQGKWKHDIEFSPTDPDMIALSAVATAQVPGFDFDALWAAGEALAYDV